MATKATLETPRLILRPLVASDLEDWINFEAEPENMQFLGGVRGASASWHGLATFLGSWQLRGAGYLAVIEKTSGAWIGRVGPHWPEGWPAPEFGWALDRSRRGRGFGYEASVAALRWTFSKLNCVSVIHCIWPTNSSSIALAAKLGSTRAPAEQVPAELLRSGMIFLGQSQADSRLRSAKNGLSGEQEGG